MGRGMVHTCVMTSNVATLIDARSWEGKRQVLKVPGWKCEKARDGDWLIRDNSCNQSAC